MKLPDLLFQDLSDATLKHFSAVSGGSINECYHLQLTDGQEFFLKRNLAYEFPDMFQNESKGIQLLQSAGALIPNVFKVMQDETYQYLLMSYHPPNNAQPKQWDNAGIMLAKIHKTTQDKYGLNHDNFMGSLVQVNCETDSFSEFFVNCRLLPQVKLARDSKKLNAAHSRHFDLLFEKLENLIPQENPSLVHGDLWIGNFHETAQGVMLIDPATAFSHREVDLAMTRMFGSPPEDFYLSYQSEYPLEAGFEERTALFNLYPLLIHLNLFGESYLSQVERSLFYYVR